ncbi:unnamed protein product [Candidula unifasciata]|uniref:C2H2-type domain-containing protein n=1 Tax=Candidula unifasciata TaxID=100452 RepID=A0A8S3YY62_9EUPU|nr:unnamed protein product [Candidula unifasciata]
MNSSGNIDHISKAEDIEWQIDSEWISLSASTPPSVFPVTNKKKKQSKQKCSDAEVSKITSFSFIPTSRGGRHLVVDSQTFRLSQHKAAGFSYWICSIPSCAAWCMLDAQEKRMIQSYRDHNHEVGISQKEFKDFITALKNAVKENPHMKPKVIYDIEVEKIRQQLKDNNLGNRTNGVKDFLPSFEAVHAAMLNTRNAVLSAVSLSVTGDETSVTEVRYSSPHKFTRSKDGKTNKKQRSTHSLISRSFDIDNMEEKSHNKPDKDANLSDFEEWLDDDVTPNIPVVVVSASKQEVKPVFKKTSPKETHDFKLEFAGNEENNLWDGDPHLEGISRRKYRKRPASASIFTCPHCPYKSNRHFNVQRHERLAHSTKKPEFSCKECGTSYSLEYRLKLHVKAVHQGEGHHCHICARSFETMTGLKSHVVTKHKHDDPKVHHEPPPELTCKLCGRVFSTKSHLQKHTSTHVMIQPYRCCVCNKAFMEELEWLSHQSNCTDSFTVQCCLCSAYVSTAHELMAHMDVVHGRAEYSCHCGKIFPWKKSLLTHQQKCSLFLAERSI